MYKPSILLIYTGGTIGMVKDHATGSLHPIDFSLIRRELPELQKFDFNIDAVSFETLVDSSNISPDAWQNMAKIIHENYESYDGFVILHGTDTMAYSASALSFILENNYKPVIFTGSQLPIGIIRTDGKENLITAIEIASMQQNDVPVIPEVCIYFQNKLFRGNRTTKHSVDHFNAFISENYPPLAEAGIQIRFNLDAISYPTKRMPLKINDKFNNEIVILKLFPGISSTIINCIFDNPSVKGVVMESFGAGNAPTGKWFLNSIEKALNRGIIIVNITQCNAGSIQMGLYETSLQLLNLGVISGYDMTTEAAVTKLMYLLGQYPSREEVIRNLKTNLRGEITLGE